MPSLIPLALTLGLFAGVPLAADQLTANEGRWLRGLKSVVIVVEGLDSDAEACGVRKSALELAAARPLVDAGVKVLPSPTADFDAALNVAVTVLRLSSGLCVAAYDTTARATAAGAELVYQAERRLVFAELWTESGVMTGGASDFGSRVSTTVRELTEQFATKVKLANAP